MRDRRRRGHHGTNAIRFAVARGWLALALLLAGALPNASGRPAIVPLMRGLAGWSADVLLTVGDGSIGSYDVPGRLDGLGAYVRDADTLRVLANHELSKGDGPRYSLRSGARLRGARVSFVDVDRTTRAVVAAGLAYDTMYDRAGRLVEDATQVSEVFAGDDGLDRLCSGRLVRAAERGFEDTIFFCGEETSADGSHPHGGTEWALDVAAGALWACPELGRGKWENVAPVATGDDRLVALLLGDDATGAPLYLWVGKKRRGGSFLARNGLSRGKLYAWVADGGADDPSDFHGTGASLPGRFVRVKAKDRRRRRDAGHDDRGYLDDTTLRNTARGMGAFRFSRPEDLHDDPFDGSRVVMASTGRGSSFPDDEWGTLYEVRVDLSTPKRPTATLTILHDGDDRRDPDAGLRSPDNLVFAEDGFVYAQEDAATGAFGRASGREASVWALDPEFGTLTRIAEMDRDGVPAGQRDSSAGRIGAWESSGVLDVTRLLRTAPGERVLMLDVQAHGISLPSDGAVEGGQLLLLSIGGD